MKINILNKKIIYTIIFISLILVSTVIINNNKNISTPVEPLNLSKITTNNIQVKDTFRGLVFTSNDHKQKDIIIPVSEFQKKYGTKYGQEYPVLPITIEHTDDNKIKTYITYKPDIDYKVIGDNVIFYKINFSEDCIGCSNPKIIQYQQLPDTYQDYNGIWHEYNDNNIQNYPLYSVVDNGNNYTISRMDDSITITKANTQFNFNPTRISFTINVTPSQLNSRSIQDGSNWYIKIPKSLYSTRFIYDNLKPVVTNETGSILTDINYWYIDGSDTKLYYNNVSRTFGTNSKYILFTFNSYVVNNATTTGWTSTNISLINTTKDLSSGNISNGFLYDSFSGNTLSSRWTSSGSTVESGGYLNISGSGSKIKQNISVKDKFNATVDILTVANGSSSFNVPFFKYLVDYKDENNRTVVYISTGNQSVNEVDYNSLQNSNFGTANTVNYKIWNTYFINTNGSTTNFIVNNTQGLLLTSSNITNLKNNITQSEVIFDTGSSAVISNMKNVRYWQNNTGEIQFYNQTTQTNYYVNRTKVIGYNFVDNLTMDLYYRNNGTSTWNLIQSNLTNDTWYNINNTISYLDFRVVLNGNSSNAPIFSYLEVDDYAGVPPTPVSCSAVIGNFFVNTSCLADSGFKTDSMNKTNGTVWDNTSNFYLNDTLSPHAWDNISFYAFNTSSGMYNTTPATLNTQIQNNPITIGNISTYYNITEGNTLAIYPNRTDADNDTPLFGTNSTKGSFITSSGNLSWNTQSGDVGTYNWYINVSDGFSSISTKAFQVNVGSSTPTPISNLAGIPFNFGINWTWNSGGNADRYAIQLNETNYGYTTNLYYNATPLLPHANVKISVASHNDTLNSNSSWTNNTTTIPNNPITLTSPGDKTINEGSLLQFTLSSSDLDSDTPTYSTTATKGSLNINTGQFTWTPNYGDAGVYIWSFGASDGYGSVDNKTITITVNNVNLVITSYSPLTDPTSTYQNTQSFNIQTNHSTNITWYVDGVLKQTNSGVTTSTYNNNTAYVGTHTVLSSAEDGTNTVTHSWTWTVTPVIVTLGSSSTNASAPFYSVFKCQPVRIWANFTNYANITNVNAAISNKNIVRENGAIVNSQQVLNMTNAGTGHYYLDYANDPNTPPGNKNIVFIVNDGTFNQSIQSGLTLIVSTEYVPCSGTVTSYTQLNQGLGNRTTKLIQSYGMNPIAWGFDPWIKSWGYWFFIIVILMTCAVVYMKTQKIMPPIIVAGFTLFTISQYNIVPISLTSWIILFISVCMAGVYYLIFIRGR